MARVYLLVFVFLCHLGLHSADQEMKHHPNCPPFPCGKLGEIKFPFTNSKRPPHCGLLTVEGCDNGVQKIKLERGGRWYEISSISQAEAISIDDKMFSELLNSRNCRAFKYLNLPNLPYLSFQISQNLTLFECNNKLSDHPSLLEYSGCNNSSIYYTEREILPSLPPQCSLIQLPRTQNGQDDIFTQLTANFSLEVHVHWACRRCYYRGGDCQVNSKQKFYCANAEEGNNKFRLKFGLGADLELGGAYFGVPLFSYTELEEATSNFDSRKELGDGGFGTVYYGKLRDGREVAVKRLYEHNYRRVAQFMNEIEILTRLRHKNLVTLYGCTSRRSHDLLLVYEYVPNGTVADHLHGDRAKSSPLTWPIRMSIAIETASALVYLHASDIIHRDVKTTNILLDNNFCVKVADFGLSRLFPNDVTHVSTAPQGTPGYVDPEYHQCYQLTDKSDVYSFGVVLIELISSMPAVDINRHRHEINLANLAVNRIQKCEFDELIDPSFGYNSDEEVKTMTITVAELAFRCLQQDKEMRPTMDEVLEELKRIESAEFMENPEEIHDDNKPLSGMLPPSSPPDCDDASLLKNIRSLPSPDTVTAKWASSCSTTPNVSGKIFSVSAA
ncbi:LEAF RUST 10 DISEASE-RESISTANCE LOCUS RECEPTOR-LIKE PROTEIN KINASE-like 1.1 isoform X4 [Hevea brasiliensis]|uniref:LEAF RUST 10 DISEASE-RESISTANCE LOCUS RECEPTOR-LIKE PROTEIN KINASE-like 1.1 isoform X4 n=1 Tax=Hevea brasiliensis TaxID=3981 RepID=UPI0025FD5C13|nr:LEAF RUST 10 DISEASE-RESISTANCE LOCUS RECEPTOR-LIKE PROTEIN KINASE-like 1.1 isoform X4 [Hevea brasiliensis]